MKAKNVLLTCIAGAAGAALTLFILKKFDENTMEFDPSDDDVPDDFFENDYKSWPEDNITKESLKAAPSAACKKSCADTPVPPEYPENISSIKGMEKKSKKKEKESLE